MRRKSMGNCGMTATIYIIEDTANIRGVLSELVELNDMQAREFDSAEAFLESFTPPAGPACILCDVCMPGVSGLELQKILKQQGNQIPFIVMTGHADVSMAVEAMKAGAFDFIEKPFDNQHLFNKINEGLEAYEKICSIQRQQELARSKIARLTRREKQVMDLLVKGGQNRDIAEQLDISPRTVEIHRARVMEKLEASSVSDVTRIAISAAESIDDNPA